jgi:hypothetical protein
MRRDELINALCYELIIQLKDWHPQWFRRPWVAKLAKMILDNCRPDWVKWKTEKTMKKVDEQAVVIVKQWEKESRETVATQLADKAKELFPKATITPLPDAVVPSVMIVHEAEPSDSEAIKILGKELRITWTLDSLK